MNGENAIDEKRPDVAIGVDRFVGIALWRTPEGAHYLRVGQFHKRGDTGDVNPLMCAGQFRMLVFDIPMLMGLLAQHPALSKYERRFYEEIGQRVWRGLYRS